MNILNRLGLSPFGAYVLGTALVAWSTAAACRHSWMLSIAPLWLAAAWVAWKLSQPVNGDPEPLKPWCLACGSRNIKPEWNTASLVLHLHCAMCGAAWATKSVAEGVGIKPDTWRPHPGAVAQKEEKK
jgi:hypothetical protein